MRIGVIIMGHAVASNPSDKRYLGVVVNSEVGFEGDCMVFDHSEKSFTPSIVANCGGCVDNDSDNSKKERIFLILVPLIKTKYPLYEIISFVFHANF